MKSPAVILIALVAAVITPNAAFGYFEATTSNQTQRMALPNNINAARLFYAYKCDSLANAVPEAIASGLQILVGLDDSDANFCAEKGMLIDSMENYGWGWILGVAVGSESLYRGAITPNSLADKIHDVKGSLKKIHGYPGRMDVGHVDTTNAWFDSTSKAVMVACDFIGVDIYPYFQTENDNHINNAGQIFDDAVAQAFKCVAAAGSKASVWVTETGWPVTGSVLGAAVPSKENAASYYQQVACPSFEKINTFWFTYQDWFATPSFAVFNAKGYEYFSQTCRSTK